MRSTAQQLSIVTAARGLLEAAREEARSLPKGSPEWTFYYGVQTAATESLHAALETVHAESTAWLEAEPPLFRDGYLKARAALAMARTAIEPPLRVPLPKP